MNQRRDVRSIEAIMRLREAEEHRALGDVVRGRESLESHETDLEDVRQRIRDVMSDDLADDSGVELIRGRMFVDILRGCAERIAEDLRADRQELEELQEAYQRARSRRRVLERLRDNRVERVELERERSDDRGASTRHGIELRHRERGR